MGNPPFLGSQLIRGNLPESHTDSLFQLYGARIPNYSDYCCYWFEKARQMIEDGSAQRVGLLATQEFAAAQTDVYWSASKRRATYLLRILTVRGPWTERQCVYP